MKPKTPVSVMYSHLANMKDNEVQRAWDALGQVQWGEGDMSSYPGVSMDDWAEAVKAEYDKRLLGEEFTGICCECQTKVPCRQLSTGGIVVDMHCALNDPKLPFCKGYNTAPQVSWQKKQKQQDFVFNDRKI